MLQFHLVLHAVGIMCICACGKKMCVQHLCFLQAKQCLEMNGVSPVAFTCCINII